VEAAVGRIVGRVLLWVVASVAVVWAADWAVWQAKVVAGRGYGVIGVDRFVVAPLKNHKEEYYPDGRVEVRCTRSGLPEGLPQQGGQPCWWVARHPVVFDR
jgi:hypothetical protein